MKVVGLVVVSLVYWTRKQIGFLKPNLWVFAIQVKCRTHVLFGEFIGKLLPIHVYPSANYQDTLMDTNSPQIWEANSFSKPSLFGVHISFPRCFCCEIYHLDQKQKDKFASKSDMLKLDLKTSTPGTTIDAVLFLKTLIEILYTPGSQL